ncbi:unnamed protein product [Linum tenue]|uniref:Uncharacterized protein n=1 Tax=Linum tenue TaxID=586396 RepID=A0AAV0LAE5_9ROSI|nr:unnamed protein product [Linum tenue]
MLVLHPEKPEIVFLEVRDSHRGGGNKEAATTVFTCDMRKGNLEYFARVKRGASRWPVFHPRANYKCLPTPIPRHLKGASTV